MTGWRAGYMIATAEWTNGMIKLQSHSATHPTSFVQYACALALRDADDTIAADNAMTGEYERRHDWLITDLNKIKGFKCPMPDRAFNAFVDVRELIGEEFTSSGEVASHLLNEAQIVATDGEGFGGPGSIRFSYATSMKDIERAVTAMKGIFGSAERVAA